jgi:glycosyltransferase involved in cell wall biosynthesis
VVVADNSSLKEIGGSAVLQFKTADSQDLAKKVDNLLNCDKMRGELIKSGKKRLENFSWEKCVQETLNFIKLS